MFNAHSEKVTLLICATADANVTLLICASADANVTLLICATADASVTLLICATADMLETLVFQRSQAPFADCETSPRRCKFCRNWLVAINDLEIPRLMPGKCHGWSIGNIFISANVMLDSFFSVLSDHNWILG